MILKRKKSQKFFPKDKKYISLFPQKNKIIDEKAKLMQEGIMVSINKMLEGFRNKKYDFSKKNPEVPERKKNDYFFLDPEEEIAETAPIAK